MAKRSKDRFDDESLSMLAVKDSFPALRIREDLGRWGFCDVMTGDNAGNADATEKPCTQIAIRKKTAITAANSCFIPGFIFPTNSWVTL